MSVIRTVKTVLWSFLGVRKRNAFDEDLGKANPIAIIAVALSAVLLFVVGLIGLVHWIVKH